jgi:putative ABC transport system ATP-binding protein
MIHGVSQSELARIRNRKIGFVFQFFNLLPKLNVVQNVELPLLYSGARSRERSARALDALRWSVWRIAPSPAHAALRRPATARGHCARSGEQPAHRLRGRTHRQPRLEHGRAILDLFQKLSGEGRTIALVTHDPAIAALTPRRIEIRDGKLRRTWIPFWPDK